MTTIIERWRTGRWFRVGVLAAGVVLILAVVSIAGMLLNAIGVALGAQTLSITWTEYAGIIAILAWAAYFAYRLGKYCDERSVEAWVPVPTHEYRVRRVRR